MGGGKKENAPEIDNLSSLARNLFNETAGLRKEFTAQGLEALKTGGISAQLPMIARAVEASKGQLSQDLQSTQDSLARSGLVGTPFGQNILAQGRIMGGQNISNIPTSFAQNTINMIPNFIAAMTGQSMGGAGQAAQAQSSLYGSYNNAYSNILSAGIPSAMQMGGKLISGAAGGMMPTGGAMGAGGGGMWV